MPKIRQIGRMEEPQVSEDWRHMNGKRKAVREEEEEQDLEQNAAEDPPSKQPRKESTGEYDSPLIKFSLPGKFMKMNEVFAILKKPERVLEFLPEGEKDNVYFVMEDSKNALRREKNLSVRYIDDSKDVCNKGNAGSNYVQYINGKVTPLRFKDKAYCYPVYENNRTTYQPLDPQPGLEDLHKVDRYYASIGRNRKRRITAVAGKGFKAWTLFEYCTVEGDAKQSYTTSESCRVSTKTNLKDDYSNSPARRKSFQNYEMTSKPDTRKIREKIPIKSLRSKTVKDKEKGVALSVDKIRGEMGKENERERIMKSTQKDEIKEGKNREIRSPRKKMGAKEERVVKEERIMKATPNEASQIEEDEESALVAMLEGNPSVQMVISRKNKPPSVIIYSEKQLGDMKRNLEYGSVLGVDCTHKFGDCHVTLTVYQNSRALHKETNEPLLYLGPVLLHWDEEFLTYAPFFSHITDKLGDIEPGVEVKLRSSLESSLFAALKQSFPKSPQMINAIHLKTLVDRHLPKVTDGKAKTCLEISRKIFGPQGIASSLDLATFERRVKELWPWVEKFPKLKVYFERLEGLLYPYLCELQESGASQKLWTDGNDEVLSELISKFFQRRHYKVSDIIEKIGTITRLQMMKLDSV